MSIIDSLPPEIVAEIVTSYAREEFCPPTKLLAVSKLWRDLIMTTPAAWAVMTIPCISGSMDIISFVERWLDRSGAAPLCVALELHQAEPVPVLRASSKLMEQKV